MSPSFPPDGAAVPNVILGTFRVAVLSAIVSVPSVTTSVDTIPVAELSVSLTVKLLGTKILGICVRSTFQNNSTVNPRLLETA